MARTSSSLGAAAKPHSALPSSTQSDTFRGNGGELQQQANGKHPTLTTQQGIAVAAASALPVSIERINRWAQSLEAKKIAIVPVSAARDFRSPKTTGSIKTTGSLQ